MKTMKKLLVMLLVMAMAFSMVAPVFADDPATYTVTINSNGNMTTPATGHDHTDDDTANACNRFWAYQIFKGSLTTDLDQEGAYVTGNNTVDESTGYTNPNANWLTNVQWGSGIDTTKLADLLYALATDTTKAADLGITADKLLAAGKRYESAYKGIELNALDSFPEATWEETDGGKTGFTLTGSTDKYDTYAEAYAAAANADINTKLGTLTLGELFKAALKYAGFTVENNTVTGNATETEYPQVNKDSAAVVARVLSDFTQNMNGQALGGNAALAEAFAKVVYTKDENDVTDGLKFLKNDSVVKSKWNADANGGKGGWDITIPQTESGYYLIKDTYNEDDDAYKSQSDFVVGVFGNHTITAKSELPEVDKRILGYDPNENDKGVDSEIGKKLTFELEGTIAENYLNYKSYYYEFVDTLSKGLTYAGNDTVKVRVALRNPAYMTEAQWRAEDAENRGDGVADGRTALQKIEYFDVDITELAYVATDREWGYQVTKTDNATGETTLSVKFADLKQVDLSGLTTKTDTNAGTLEEQVKAQLEAAGITGEALTTAWAALNGKLAINRYTHVFVNYDAYLNNAAEVKIPNTNDVKLVYSNDPTFDGNGEEPKGETPKKVVYVYDFAIDLTKYDLSTGDAKEKLAGAAFDMTKVEKTYTIDGKKVPDYILAAYLNCDVDDIEWNPEYANKTLAEISLALATAANHPTADNPEPYYTNVNYDNLKATADWGAATPTTYYALFAPVMQAEPNADKLDYYALAGWVDGETNLLAVINKALGRTVERTDGVAADEKYTALDQIKEEDWLKLSYDKVGIAVASDDNTLKGYLNEANKTADKVYLDLVTDDQGKLNIHGFENGTYSLHEVVAPKGYDKLTSSIDVTYTAEYFTAEELANDRELEVANRLFPADAQPGMLKKLTVKVNNQNLYADGVTDADESKATTTVLVMNGYWANKPATAGAEATASKFPANVVPTASENPGQGEEDLDKLAAGTNGYVAAFDVANTPNGWLPGTGGIGTTIFYVAGGVLLVAAAMFMVFSGKKKAEEN